MKTRTPKAVWVVSALGLLLGISLGHNQRLQNHIQELERQGSVNHVILNLNPAAEPLHAEQFRREVHQLKENLHAEAERLRARYEREQMRRQNFSNGE